MEYYWIAVIHNWFMYSEGFKLIELGKMTAKEAEKERCVLHCKNDGILNETAVMLIKMEDNKRIFRKSRKLTWKERLTGNFEGGNW